ncbi:MAG TPA: PepSY-associated TM helix domain-containing protein [Rhodocyclaceae bacterium]|nr:PepSY-associated TM helix domain-containing protein [Rhodocyclaceae bacterium]
MSVKSWFLVHKWTSLICTLILLLTCITGLPLIFQEEIDHLMGEVEAPEMPADTPNISLDHIVGTAEVHLPGKFVQFLSWDNKEHPHQVFVSLADSRTAPPDNNTLLIMDSRTAEVLEQPVLREGFMYWMLKLHTDLFVGLPGTLFIGFMGLLFVVAIVSGVVLYKPFMRKLDFGDIRTKTPRLKWLDIHNLLGIATLVWATVVGATGVINALNLPILALWQSDQLADMTAPYRNAPPLERFGSVEAAVATAVSAAPHMEPSLVAFPGTQYTSPHHYAVFMRGSSPLTSKLFMPALIDADNGRLTDLRPMPWYVNALFIAVPLHFGDYAGLPLKILWAVLDLITIAVLLSGLYLWWKRRKMTEARVAHLHGLNQSLDKRSDHA